MVDPWFIKTIELLIRQNQTYARCIKMKLLLKGTDGKSIQLHQVEGKRTLEETCRKLFKITRGNMQKKNVDNFYYFTKGLYYEKKSLNNINSQHLISGIP